MKSIEMLSVKIFERNSSTIVDCCLFPCCEPQKDRGATKLLTSICQSPYMEELENERVSRVVCSRNKEQEEESITAAV